MCREGKGRNRVVCVYRGKGGNSVEFLFREENAQGCRCLKNKKAKEGNE